LTRPFGSGILRSLSTEKNMTRWVVECGANDYNEEFVSFRKEFETETEAEEFADVEDRCSLWDFVRVVENTA
jgi:hypothetical protein